MTIERVVKRLVEAADLPDGLRAELLASLAQRSAPMVDGSQIRNLLVDEGMLQDLAVAVNKIAEPVQAAADHASGTTQWFSGVTLDAGVGAGALVPAWAGKATILGIATVSAVYGATMTIGVQCGVGAESDPVLQYGAMVQSKGEDNVMVTATHARTISAPGSAVGARARGRSLPSNTSPDIAVTVSAIAVFTRS